MLVREMCLLPDDQVTLRFDDAGIRETLDHICRTLRFPELPEDYSPARPPRENERRSFPRISLRHLVSLTPVSVEEDRIRQVGESVLGATTSLSRSGVGLAYSTELPSTAVITTFDENVLPSLVVRMCWQRAESGLWKGGGRFIAVMEPHGLDTGEPLPESALC